MKYLPIIFFCLAILLVNCQKSDDMAEANELSLIKPGQGVGELSLDFTAAEVENVFGEGWRRVDTFLVGTTLNQQLIFYIPQGLAVTFELITSDVFDEDALVNSYQIFAPFEGATPEGLGLLSTRQEVINNYGVPDSINTDNKGEYYLELGISFHYEENLEVAGISVFK